MIEIRRFQFDDVWKIPGFENGDQVDHYRDMEETARTLTVDSKPIASLGAQIMWEGTATVWAILSTASIKDYRKSLCRMAVNLIRVAEHDFGLKRLQAFVRADHAAAVRWAEWLGFERECLMRRFCQNSDFWLYAKVSDE